MLNLNIIKLNQQNLNGILYMLLVKHYKMITLVLKIKLV